MVPDKEVLLRTADPNKKHIPIHADYLLTPFLHKDDRELTHDYSITNFWKPNEWVWHGTVPKELCLFDTLDEVAQGITDYFHNNKWQADISDYDRWDNIRTQDFTMENFLKLVWLTNEYLDNPGFKNSLSTHWNPRLGGIAIHPGGARSIIVNLFGGPTQEAFFFNTGGVLLDFMKDMQPVDLQTLLQDTENPDDKWGCSGVPDHGSIIPHFGKGMHTIGNNKLNWYHNIHSRITENKLRVYVNHDDSHIKKWCSPWIVPKSEATVTVHFNNPPNRFDDVQAVLALFANKDFKNHKVAVIHQ